MMNRAQLRSVQHLPAAQFYQVIGTVVEEEAKKRENFAYYNAWVSTFLALHDRWPDLITGDMLHTIAVDTLEYINGLETPTELAEILLERTGFDIYKKPSDDTEHRYVEK